MDRNQMVVTTIRDMEGSLGVKFKGNVLWDKQLLNYRSYGQFVKETGDIKLSEHLYQLNPHALKHVLRHELAHALMWQEGYKAYDDTSKFESILKQLGLITNGNYPNTRKVVLAHGIIKECSCGRCGTKLFDLIESNDFKMTFSDEVLSSLCDCKLPRIEVGKPKVIYYHTYEYLSYNSRLNLYHKSSELEYYKYYSQQENIPKEGYV